MQRESLIRSRDNRMIAGVAGAVARHLALPVRTVRIAFALAGLFGPGLVLYLWLWAFVPASAAAVTSNTDNSSRSASEFSFRDNASADVILGGLLLVGGLAIAASLAGWSISLTLVLPLLIAIAGIVMVFRQLDEVQSGRWSTQSMRRVVAQVGVGALLVLLGVMLLVVREQEWAAMIRVAAAIAAVLVGLAAVLVPWGVRLWRELDLQRVRTTRAAERAEIAAHLHDSVLQTLTLIQKHRGDPVQVATLARTQERDLRSWLYERRENSTAAAESQPLQLQAEVARLVAELEDRYSGRAEVVSVGDCIVTQRHQVLIDAVCEAVTNALRHGRSSSEAATNTADVHVYAEVAADEVSVSVRDHGPGFDMATVPEDRMGIRHSIIGRMQRQGGHASLTSTAGGTRVTLKLPAADSQQ